MTEHNEEQRIIKGYLLGELDSEQQQLEQRLLTGDKYFEELLIIEDAQSKY
jgi:hypothetical protein